MRSKKNINKKVGTQKLLSIALMFMCLTFMTSVNYFLYPAKKQANSGMITGKASGESKNNFPPSGPTEEKSSSQGFSVLEEFLHNSHPVIDFGVASQPALHGLADPGRILVYHGELLSPPPEL